MLHGLWAIMHGFNNNKYIILVQANATYVCVKLTMYAT